MSIGVATQNAIGTFGGVSHKTPIRQWLQDRLNENDDPGRILVSRWLKFEALLWLVDKILSTRYGERPDREIDS